jgi:ABC-type amino acid transport substrate-binding protein
MFPKGQDDVVEAFNTALVELRNSGELASILEPYGVTEQDLAEAGQKTAEEVCAGT